MISIRWKCLKSYKISSNFSNFKHFSHKYMTRTTETVHIKLATAAKTPRFLNKNTK